MFSQSRRQAIALAASSRVNAASQRSYGAKSARAKLGSETTHSGFVDASAYVARANVGSFRGFRWRLIDFYNCASESEDISVSFRDGPEF
jgi:hypothetical protein